MDEHLKAQFRISWETDEHILKEFPVQALELLKILSEEVHIVQTNAQPIANDIWKTTTKQLRLGKRQSKINRKSNGVLMSVDDGNGEFLSSVIKECDDSLLVHSVFTRFLCSRDLTNSLKNDEKPVIEKGEAMSPIRYHNDSFRGNARLVATNLGSDTEKKIRYRVRVPNKKGRSKIFLTLVMAFPYQKNAAFIMIMGKNASGEQEFSFPSDPTAKDRTGEKKRIQHSVTAMGPVMTVGIDFTTMLKLSDFVELFSKQLQAQEEKQEETLRQLSSSDVIMGNVIKAVEQNVSEHGKFFFTNHWSNGEIEGETLEQRRSRLAGELITKALLVLYEASGGTVRKEFPPDEEKIRDACDILSDGVATPTVRSRLIRLENMGVPDDVMSRLRVKAGFRNDMNVVPETFGELYPGGKVTKEKPPRKNIEMAAERLCRGISCPSTFRKRLQQLKDKDVPPDVWSDLCVLAGYSAEPISYDMNAVPETFGELYPGGKVTKEKPPRKNIEMAAERLCRGIPCPSTFYCRLRQLKGRDVPDDVLSELRDWRRELNGLEGGKVSRVVLELHARRRELNGLEGGPDTNVVQETLDELYADVKITDEELPLKNVELAFQRLCRGNPKNGKFNYRLRQLKQKDVPPDVVSKLRDWRRELNGLERGPDTYE